MSNQQSKKRTYHSPLRRQQQEMTINAIMHAVKTIILEGNLHNFTIHNVAKRAGVSYGSVYRYFESREALIKGFRDWSLKHISPAPSSYVETLEALPAWVERTIPLFMEHFPKIRALYAAMSAMQIHEVHEESKERDEWIARLVENAAPDADEDTRKASASVIRLLVSMQEWITLYYRYGLKEREMILTVTEGIKAQIQYLKSSAHIGAKPETGGETP